MNHPVQNYTELSCGIFLIFTTTYTLYKVLLGSRSSFAILMLACSYGYAIKLIGWFVIDRYPVSYDYCDVGLYLNFYAEQANYMF